LLLAGGAAAVLAAGGVAIWREQKPSMSPEAELLLQKGMDALQANDALFQPPMRDLWHSPQFDDLLTRIGLTAYWASSWTGPDFKRNA